MANQSLGDIFAEGYFHGTPTSSQGSGPRQFDNFAAQGDIMIQRIDALPPTTKATTPVGGKYIVTHSETGHHHSMGAAAVSMYDDTSDPNLAYLRVVEPTVLVHEKNGPDAHKALMIKAGVYQVNRQLESRPSGWERVAD